MSKQFDKSLYKESLRILTNAKVPQELAENASKIIASDTPTLQNFGRTPEDQEIVKQVLPYLNKD